MVPLSGVVSFVVKTAAVLSLVAVGVVVMLVKIACAIVERLSSGR